MARIVYCRHVGCGHSEEIVAGQLSVTCRQCKKKGCWSYTPGQLVKAHAKDARPGQRITAEDQKFLRSYRIAPWSDPEPYDDGA